MASFEMTEMYDNALLGILQHVGNIQDFLRVYFGFLYRKTDFYRLLTGPEGRMGFPPGVAEKMVLRTFKLFEKIAEHDRERQQVQMQAKQQSEQTPPAIQELEVVSEPQEEVTTSEIEPQQQPQQLQQQQQQQQQQQEQEEVEREEKREKTLASAAPDASKPAHEPAAGDGTHQKEETDGAKTTEEGSQQHFQANPESYNGAVRDTYSWSQDYTDVEVRVFVPKNIVKGRQVTVSLQTSSMRVCVRDGGEEKVLMEGEFTHKINTENSLWSLEPGRCVLLSLSKTSEVWWNAVLKGEQEIDISKINCERSMASIGDEEHAVLDRLTFDYHQKLQGKPQSHEMKAHDMLRKGWDAEGSPFRGQQFDPSMFDIPHSAVQF